MEVVVGTGYYKLYTDIPDDIADKGLYEPHTFHVKEVFGEVYQQGYWGSFIFAPLPGCCGVVVSTSSQIVGPKRVESGKQFHQLKEVVAKQLGYSLMIATTQLRNFPEVIGAAKNGWRHIHAFRNKRTDNDLSLMIKELK